MSENSPHDSTSKKPSARFYIIIGIIAMIAFVFLFINSHEKRKHREEEAKKASAVKPPVVRISQSHKPPDTTVLLLPGNLQGIRETSLYARVNGFVKNWYVDIGDKVKAGQLLAELETPELDQQLDQAKASLDLATTSYDRVKSVSIAGAVSVQQKADREGGYKTALAQVNQLEAQKSFKRVTAPFDGVITSRSIDIGSLINAGNSLSQQMFTLAQINRLRIFVFTPQTFVQDIRVGTSAQIVVPELGGDPGIGKVTRTAGALNPDTRTLLTQVEFDNPARLFLPGMYAKVKFVVRRIEKTLIIPANTLVIRTEGPQVVTVKEDSTLQIKPVVIGRDLGATIEITGGLEGNEKLVTNPSLNLTQGLKVTIAEPTKSKPGRGDQSNGQSGSAKKSKADSSHHKK
jgi:membrane fusion protein (multidrug efflux system)